MRLHRAGDEAHETAGRRGGSFTVFGATIEADRVPPGLHVVATPIGNLGDMTLRALATLAGSDAILAEDTRVTRVLLAHYGIDTPLLPYHEHNAASVRPYLIGRLASGDTLALVSDAGTPLVSDPGFKLVADAVAAGLPVTTAPGASAVMAALVLSGLPTDRFFFEGFLPVKAAARRTRLSALAPIPGTLVFFESARRLPEALADVASVLGDRQAVVARELTKKFETVRRGAVSVLASEFVASGPPKGEVVLLVAAAGEAPPLAAVDLDARLTQVMAALSVKDAAALVAAETGLPRRDVYGRAIVLAASRRPE